MRLYTPKQTAEILGVDIGTLFNYLRDSGYWRFLKSQNKFLPYSRYCKPKKRGKYEWGYFALREHNTPKGQIRIGLITERGLEMLKSSDITKPYIIYYL